MTSHELPLAGSYDDLLVTLSVIIAILASYAALDLARRVTSAQGKARILWLTGGATAMGFGIWSMHYIGMLAFRLPVPGAVRLAHGFALAAGCNCGVRHCSVYR